MTFLNKKNCPLCSKRLVFLSTVRIKDEMCICMECALNLDVDFEVVKFLSVDDLLRRKARRLENYKEFQSFNTTREVKVGGWYFREDSRLKRWYVSTSKKPQNPTLFRYDEIANYNLEEDGVSITSGGLGRAVVGGGLFGGVGAVVGAVTGSKKVKKEVSALNVNITLNNDYKSNIVVSCLAGGLPCKTGSYAYQNSIQSAKNLLSMLDSMCSKANIMQTSNHTDSYMVKSATSDNKAAPEMLSPQLKRHTRFCAECGNPLHDGAKFCSYCGKQVFSLGGENVLETHPQETEKNAETSPAILPEVVSEKVLSNTVNVSAVSSDTWKNCAEPLNKKKTGCFRKILYAIGIYVLISVFVAIVAQNENMDKRSSSQSSHVNSTTVEDKSIGKPVENTPKPLPKIEQTVEKPYEAPILAGAIYKYPETEKELKKAGFPKTLKKLGLSNIKKANKLMPLAAKKAAQNKGCDAVMTVDISDRSAKDNLIIYVWAKNNTKFYFTEQELLQEGSAISEQEKLAPLLTRHELMAEDVIKSQLHYPSTYDRHVLGVFKSETTASCNQITIEFSAKNGFGVEQTYIATVQFNQDSKVVGFHMQEKL